MKTDIWQTNFGGNTQTHCQLIIEEIIITDNNDRKRAANLTDINDHNGVRIIATKYTNNSIFKEMVQRIEELNELEYMTDEQHAEHQALVRFSGHFAIVF